MSDTEDYDAIFEKVVLAYGEEDSELAHYGTLHKSGRYKWGSGDNPNQRNRSFLDEVDALHKQGYSEKQIAEGMGMATTELRVLKTLAKNEQRAALQAQASEMSNRGMSNIAIGKELGLNESRVRTLLNPAAVERNNRLRNTADMLKAQIDEKGSLDIGLGTEIHAGISRTQLLQAVAVLKDEGYKMQYESIQQQGTGKNTTLTVLRHPDTDWKQIRNNPETIGTLASYSEDRGVSWNSIKPPLNVSSKRLEVRYGPDGGEDMDGVVQIRRGVKDLSMGGAQYAQVRISVDGTHYVKGMAMYADDLPPGVDMRFNTNKNPTGNKLDALKPLKSLKDGETNPFGATVRQILDKPGDPNGKPISAMNIVNEEGSWDKWGRNISSQVLSKQSPKLAEKQLELRMTEKRQEFDEIMKLTNPEVKRKLLQSYSDDLDSSSVKLKAAALPRQRTQVILPINSLKDNEVYAPNFKDGESVVLIRYPHGGIFEIPELRVNNRNKEARAVLQPGSKKIFDAVGINSKVASRLSGADFDGDTVLVIPNNSGAIKTAQPLKALKGFSPTAEYPAYDGMKTIDGGTWSTAQGKAIFPKGKGPSGRAKQQKMGDVSNLITDMTIKGAPHHEIAKAVKHSMVVIDAEKHHLNFKQSAIDNDIPALKKKYQGKSNAGADTLISKASSSERVGERSLRKASEGGPIDPKTGKKVYTYTNATYTNAAGKVIPKTVKSTKMAEADDAFDLIRGEGTQMERVYAKHANALKSLANESRKAQLTVGKSDWSVSAKKTYSDEVAQLNAKLNIAKKNAPLERQAQAMAGAIVRAKQDANPGMDHAELKKVKNTALVEARNRTGAGKQRIVFTDKEWEAIQAGAVSSSMVKQMLDNADMDRVKELATPRTGTVMTGAKQARAKAMQSSGFTPSEIAEALGVSVSTLNSSLKPKE